METLRDRGFLSASRPDPTAYKLLAGFSVYFVLVAALALGLTCAPDSLTLHLFGRTFAPADLCQRVLRRGLIVGILVPALLAVELGLCGWADSSLRRVFVQRSGSAWSDVANFLFWNAPGHLVTSNLISLGVVMLSAPMLHQMVVKTVGVSIELAAWPLAVQVVLYFYIFSFFDYWQHRLDHTARFWPLHRYHHSAEEFCVLTSVRLHPANFTGVITNLVPALLFGVSEEAFFWFWTLNAMVHYLIHTRSQSDFGWIGRWLIQSPLHHRLHHKLDMTEPTGNFSLVPLWDRLFGTWQEVKDPQVQIGVATPYRHGAWVVPDLVRDYRDFWLALIGRYRDIAGMPTLAERAPPQPSPQPTS
jgi:sterol desaturase/sphingolipid hydroxylase (fatty acid hydroxylase superfamily)